LSARNSMLDKLKTELSAWYSNNGRYFGYDASWGGIIGMPRGDDYWTVVYSDHHFHYGYFIYASAILALFDPDFASASQYRGIADLLLADFANTDRASASFPYLRNFDAYEGHSWAAGMGGQSEGNNHESSSEAMSAWAGVYLWGLATGRQNLMDLGVYLYATEYEAIKEYYFDANQEIYTGTGIDGASFSYARRGGILGDNRYEWALWWSPLIGQTVLGIQLLPSTPSMLYLGYNSQTTSYIYNIMDANRGTGSNQNFWQDIWSRFKALFNAPQAISDFAAAIASGFGYGNADNGSSFTYTYHFMHFFNALGTVATSASIDNGGQDYYCDANSYNVMYKGGEASFIAFNESSSAYKTVNFYSRTSGHKGTMSVPPMTTAQTKDFVNFKYDSLRAMYSTDAWHALTMDKYSDSVLITSAAVPTLASASYEILPVAFNVKSSGLSAATPIFVKCSGLAIPPGFSANQIRLFVYNPVTQLPKSTLPVQSIEILNDYGSTADILISASITEAGNLEPTAYILAIPSSSPSGDTVFVSGLIENVRTGSPIGGSIIMHAFDTVERTTRSFDVSGGAYTEEFYCGRLYILTPQSSSYVFTDYGAPNGSADFVFVTPSSTTPTTQNFSAYPVYSISGNIKNPKNFGAPNIEVRIYDTVANSTKTAITDSYGDYSSAIVYNRRYIITPSSELYIFQHVGDSYQYYDTYNVSGDYQDVDFKTSINPNAKLIVYPNPYNPSRHSNSGITFSGLRLGAKVRIYNIAGEKIFEGTATTDGEFIWRAQNSSGSKIASGIYIYYAESAGRVFKGKIAVER